MSVNRRGRMIAGFLLLFASSAYGQSTIALDSLPAVLTVQCDAPTTILEGGAVDPAKLTLALSIDGGAFTPDVSTCVFPITVTKAGDHPVAIVARYLQPDNTLKTSPPLTLMLTVTIRATFTPMPPTNARITPTSTTVGVTVAPFTDPLGHTWSLVGTNVQRDGAHAADAGACTQLILASGKVYCGASGRWYLWAETLVPPATSHWTDVGTATPKH